jgi:YggT family protein
VNLFVLLGWLILGYVYLIVFPYALMSWFRVEPGTVWARIQYFLYRATEPVLRPLRQLIKPVGGLDLSILVVFIVAQILVYKVLWA